MRLNKCKFCGQFYRSAVQGVVCPRCVPLDDILFSRIENYLQKYPNSNALQISEGLEIPIMEVIRYIDEGRLAVSKGSFSKIE